MKPYVLKDEKARIYAVDHLGQEIVGARIPPGEMHWKLYLHTRMLPDSSPRCHPVVCSRDGARQWVVAFAEALYANPPLQPVWSPDSTRALLERARGYDSVDCSGSLADIEGML